MHTRALWITGRGRAELRGEVLPEPGPDEVRVRALHSGISRGTERVVWRGGVPRTEHARMRAPFQAGDFPWPVKYGYLSVGQIEAGAGPVGQRVFCLHPHQERYVVPAADCVAVPDAVPSRRAVLAGIAEVAVNALWDARIGPGDRVAVVGAGVVGCLVAWLAARIPGTRVELVDVAPERSATAAALGSGFASPAEALRGCDCAVHASGTGAGLQTALQLVGPDALVVELSWYGDRPVQLDLGGAFHAQRTTLRSSQVGSVPLERRPRWTRRRRLALAVQLLDDPRLDALLDQACGFEDLPDTVARITLDDGPGLCHTVHY